MARPLNVLVVDDTPAHQKVLKTILTKRGHRVELADNGRQAVDRIRQRPFDVVLMDVRMPIMGGVEATRKIRSLPDKQRAQVPIIATTSDATQDDRRRCLAAGIDDYLPKPIGAAALVSRVEFHGTSSAVAAPSAALNRFGGDESLLREFIALFKNDAPSLVKAIRAGLESGDMEVVVRAAHSLRSLAANFDATPTMEAATRLERLATAGGDRAAGEALQALEAELKLLVEALNYYAE